MRITKVWMQSKIQELKETDQKKLMHFVGRALLVLLENQTLSEQSSSTVLERNGIGFVSHEAEIATSHAKFYEKNRFLTVKQTDFWLKEKDGYTRICKYHRQLNKAAKEKKND